MSFRTVRLQPFARSTAVTLAFVGLSCASLCAAAADESASDVGMLVLNSEKPFVSRSFAEKLV
jgi:hypothetical protein